MGINILWIVAKKMYLCGRKIMVAGLCGTKSRRVSQNLYEYDDYRKPRCILERLRTH